MLIHGGDPSDALDYSDGLITECQWPYCGRPDKELLYKQLNWNWKYAKAQKHIWHSYNKFDCLQDPHPCLFWGALGSPNVLTCLVVYFSISCLLLVSLLLTFSVRRMWISSLSMMGLLEGILYLNPIKDKLGTSAVGLSAALKKKGRHDLLEIKL